MKKEEGMGFLVRDTRQAVNHAQVQHNARKCSCAGRWQKRLATSSWAPVEVRTG